MYMRIKYFNFVGKILLCDRYKLYGDVKVEIKVGIDEKQSVLPVD